MKGENLHTQLEQGLAYFNLHTTTEQKDKLLQFLTVLHKWNKVHNLTSQKSLQELLVRHVLDSLSVVPHIQNAANILDVGTGAGLPGIPLSIIKPELSFVLLDSSLKKIIFVEYVLTLLNITNAKAIRSRVESYNPTQKFDIVISRAFASLQKFVQQSGHICHRDGLFIAMKGKLDKAKEEQLSNNYLVTKIQEVSIPGLKAKRCLVFVKSN